MSERIYASLCALFAVLIVLGNLVYQKFVCLHLLPFHTFELSVGALLYPLTFVVTDLVTEFFGKESASFCVRLALMMNIIVAIAVMMMNGLDATTWSRVDNNTFHLVFGAYGIAFIGSLLACYVSQWVDIRVYLWLRARTSERFLWVRNNVATFISLTIDSAVVLSFLTIFGILPREQIGNLLLNSVLFKGMVGIVTTPLFYLGILTIRRLLVQKNAA